MVPQSLDYTTQKSLILHFRLILGLQDVVLHHNASIADEGFGFPNIKLINDYNLLQFKEF